MATVVEFKGARLRAFTIKIPDSERRYAIYPDTFDEGVPKLFEMEDADAAWLLQQDAESGAGNWVRYEAPAKGKAPKPAKADDIP